MSRTLSIEQEARIRQLVSELGRWPKKREFYAAGLNYAYSTMSTSPLGLSGWRAHFGIGAAPATGRPRQWTSARRREELVAFARKLGRWPARRELIEVGLGRVAQDYDERDGGLRALALAIGMDPGPERVRRDDEDALERALRAFIGEHATVFPSRREFDEAGLGALYQAAQDHPSIAHWARRLGLQYRAGTRRDTALIPGKRPRDAEHAVRWFLIEHANLSDYNVGRYSEVLWRLYAHRSGATPEALISPDTLRAFYLRAPGAHAGRSERSHINDSAARIARFARWLKAHGCADQRLVIATRDLARTLAEDASRASELDQRLHEMLWRPGALVGVAARSEPLTAPSTVTAAGAGGFELQFDGRPVRVPVEPSVASAARPGLRMAVELSAALAGGLIITGYGAVQPTYATDTACPEPC